MIDSVCGLCIVLDMFCICACRPSTSPPCLSRAPVQTCLQLACPWRVRCPANKLSVSRHMQSEEKRGRTAERQGECQIVKSEEQTEERKRKRIIQEKDMINSSLMEYNLTHACSFGHTDTHTYKHTFTHSNLTSSHSHTCEIQEAHLTMSQTRPVKRTT